MSRRNFILTVLGILLAEQFLFVIFNWQFRVSLLAVFILVTVFLDQHFGEKLGWAVLLLLIAEFKTGGPWGLLPLALLLTLLTMSGVGKVLAWPVRSFPLSALGIFFWQSFFVGVNAGLEFLFASGMMAVNMAEQWRIAQSLLEGRVGVESAVAVLGFMVYYHLIKLRSV